MSFGIVTGSREPPDTCPPGSVLHRMLRDVECASAHASHERHRAIASALAPYLGMRDLLADAGCRCSPDRYTRNLLAEGDDYSVLALLWQPGQMSPVHAHRTWCVFGIHCGVMTEVCFAQTEAGAVPVACAARRPGEVRHDAAGSGAIHRLANLGTEVAVSVHVYAARFARLGEDVNLVLAA